MIQRHLLGQSRAIAPRLQAISRAPFTQSLPRRIPTLRKASRWYSTTVQADASLESEEPKSEQPQSESNEQDPLNKALEAKNKEIIDLKDKYLRSVASFRNLQDITKRDIQTARDYAISSFATDLVESVDNLDRALATVPAEMLSSSTPMEKDNSSHENGNNDKKALVNLYEGLKMTESILMQTLKKHGLERFDPSQPGTKFDPRLHEATFQTKFEGKEDGDVLMVQQKGFMLNGRVLRAAKVGVTKNS